MFVVRSRSTSSQLPAIYIGRDQEARSDGGVGVLAMLFIILRAYSLGGGTYTGIEAVSNGLQILREPRVQREADDALHGGLARVHGRRHPPLRTS